MSPPEYDLIVIGGGIHGCAVARDAALRGLRVALFERGDLGCATSSASTKLAHGGLRYLETLRLSLVREGLRERHHLLHAAPHLTRALPFLLPLYDGGRWGRWTLRAGLTVYDLLAGGDTPGRHRRISKERCLEIEPGLRTEGLGGGFTFFDAQVDDARLCIENALDAADHGAAITPRCEVIGLLEAEGRIAGVRTRDSGGAVGEWRSRAVVNCAGPWVARVSDGQVLASRVRLRWSRGTHIVLPRRTQGHALLLTAPQDGRVVFALPYKGCTLVGTTEVEVRAATDSVEATPEEIEYLLECSRYYWPEQSASSEDVLFSFAGLRTLPGDERGPLGRISREARIQEDAPGLLTLVGGKLTTHRATAEALVDRLQPRLGESLPPSSTFLRPLPGAGGPPMNEYFEVAEDLLFEKYPQTDLGVLRHLLGCYGRRHLEVLRHFDRDPSTGRRLEQRHPFTQAEVNMLVEQEWAQSVEDLVRRRTYRIFRGGFDDAARSAWEKALSKAQALLVP